VLSFLAAAWQEKSAEIRWINWAGSRHYIGHKPARPGNLPVFAATSTSSTHCMIIASMPPSHRVSERVLAAINSITIFVYTHYHFVSIGFAFAIFYPSL
jgi:hypothetical protein